MIQERGLIIPEQRTMRFLANHGITFDGMSDVSVKDRLAGLGLRFNIFDADQGYIPTLEIVNINPYVILMVFRKMDKQGLTLVQEENEEIFKLKALQIRNPKKGLLVQSGNDKITQINQIRSIVS